MPAPKALTPDHLAKCRRRKLKPAPRPLFTVPKFAFNGKMWPRPAYPTAMQPRNRANWLLVRHSGFGLCVLLTAGACGTAGEHQSLVAVCGEQVPAALAEELRADWQHRMVSAGLSPCAPRTRRSYQLGAAPRAFYCGELDSTPVEASINQPGERGCVIELDVRADLSGTQASISRSEAQVMRFRDDVHRSLLSHRADWAEAGYDASIRTSGALLEHPP